MENDGNGIIDETSASGKGASVSHLPRKPKSKKLLSKRESISSSPVDDAKGFVSSHTRTSLATGERENLDESGNPIKDEEEEFVLPKMHRRSSAGSVRSSGADTKARDPLPHLASPTVATSAARGQGSKTSLRSKGSKGSVANSDDDVSADEDDDRFLQHSPQYSSTPIRDGAPRPRGGAPIADLVVDDMLGFGMPSPVAARSARKVPVHLSTKTPGAPLISRLGATVETVPDSTIGGVPAPDKRPSFAIPKPVLPEIASRSKESNDAELQELREENKRLNALVAELQDRNSELENALRMATKEIIKRNATIEDLEARLEEAQNSNRRLTEVLSGGKDNHQDFDESTSVDDLKRLLTEASAERDRLKIALEELNREMERYKADQNKIKGLQATILNQTQQIDQSILRDDEDRERIDALEITISQLRASIRDLQTKQEAALRDNEDLRKAAVIQAETAARALSSETRRNAEEITRLTKEHDAELKKLRDENDVLREELRKSGEAIAKLEGLLREQEEVHKKELLDLNGKIFGLTSERQKLVDLHEQQLQQLREEGVSKSPRHSISSSTDGGNVANMTLGDELENADLKAKVLQLEERVAELQRQLAAQQAEPLDPSAMQDKGALGVAAPDGASITEMQKQLTKAMLDLNEALEEKRLLDTKVKNLEHATNVLKDQHSRELQVLDLTKKGLEEQVQRLWEERLQYTDAINTLSGEFSKFESSVKINTWVPRPSLEELQAMQGRLQALKAVFKAKGEENKLLKKEIATNLAAAVAKQQELEEVLRKEEEDHLRTRADLENKIRELDSLRDATRTAGSNNDAAIKAKADEIGQLKQRLQKSNEVTTTLTAERDDLLRQIAVLRAQVKDAAELEGQQKAKIAEMEIAAAKSAAAITELEGRVKRKNAVITEQKETIAQRDSTIRDLEQRNAFLEQELTRIKAEKSALDKTLQEKVAQLALQDTTLKQQQKEIERLKQVETGQGLTIASLSTQIKERDAAILKQQQDIKILKDQHRQSLLRVGGDKDAASAQLQLQLDEAQRQLQEQQVLVAALKTQLSSAELAKATLVADVARITAERDQNLQAFDAERAQLREVSAQLQLKLEDALRMLDEKSTELTKLQRKNLQTEADLLTARRELDSERQKAQSATAAKDAAVVQSDDAIRQLQLLKVELEKALAGKVVVGGAPDIVAATSDPKDEEIAKLQAIRDNLELLLVAEQKKRAAAETALKVPINIKRGVSFSSKEVMPAQPEQDEANDKLLAQYVLENDRLLGELKAIKGTPKVVPAKPPVIVIDKTTDELLANLAAAMRQFTDATQKNKELEATIVQMQHDMQIQQARIQTLTDQDDDEKVRLAAANATLTLENVRLTGELQRLTLENKGLQEGLEFEVKLRERQDLELIAMRARIAELSKPVDPAAPVDQKELQELRVQLAQRESEIARQRSEFALREQTLLRQIELQEAQLTLQAKSLDDALEQLQFARGNITLIEQELAALRRNTVPVADFDDALKKANEDNADQAAELAALIAELDKVRQAVSKHVEVDDKITTTPKKKGFFRATGSRISKFLRRKGDDAEPLLGAAVDPAASASAVPTIADDEVGEYTEVAIANLEDRIRRLTASLAEAESKNSKGSSKKKGVVDVAPVVDPAIELQHLARIKALEEELGMEQGKFEVARAEVSSLQNDLSAAKAALASSSSAAPAIVSPTVEVRKETVVVREDFNERVSKLLNHLVNASEATDKHHKYAVRMKIDVYPAIVFETEESGAYLAMGVLTTADGANHFVESNDGKQWNDVPEDKRMDLLEKAEKFVAAKGLEISQEVVGLRGDNALLSQENEDLKRQLAEALAAAKVVTAAAPVSTAVPVVTAAAPAASTTVVKTAPKVTMKTSASSDDEDFLSANPSYDQALARAAAVVFRKAAARNEHDPSMPKGSFDPEKTFDQQDDEGKRSCKRKVARYSAQALQKIKNCRELDPLITPADLLARTRLYELPQNTELQSYPEKLFIVDERVNFSHLDRIAAMIPAAKADIERLKVLIRDVVGNDGDEPKKGWKNADDVKEKRSEIGQIINGKKLEQGQINVVYQENIASKIEKYNESVIGSMELNCLISLGFSLDGKDQDLLQTSGRNFVVADKLKHANLEQPKLRTSNDVETLLQIANNATRGQEEKLIAFLDKFQRGTKDRPGTAAAVRGAARVATPRSLEID